MVAWLPYFIILNYQKYAIFAAEFSLFKTFHPIFLIRYMAASFFPSMVTRGLFLTSVGFCKRHWYSLIDLEGVS